MTHRWTQTAATLVAALLLSPAVLAGDVDNGEKVYEHRCVQCHGPGGDALGPGANFMLPRPRVFKDNASYKFRTTPSGVLPTDEDLFRVITVGIPGTSMPGFDALPESERWDLVAYIKSLSEDFEDEDYLEEVEVPDELVAMVPPPITPEALARGEELYLANKCNQCHGDMGRGNGPSWPDLKDDWGNPILPADLTNRESYRNGATAEDIFRTITTGLNGTPMPAYVDSVDVDQRWDLTHYVRSLGPPDQETRDEIVLAIRVDALPESADDEAWDGAPTARFKTLPNIITPPRLFWSSVEYVMVQALYSETEIALRIHWNDRNASEGTDGDTVYKDWDTTIYKDTAHPDQFAVQFPVRNDPAVRPFFLMGDGKRSVNLWWWRSDTDVISEFNAKGYGTQAPQPEKSQTIQGGATWEDGEYTMFVRRSLASPDTKKDVQIETGTFLPLAFHVWDGSRGEVGNRRSVTTWYWLYLRPDMPDEVYTYPPFAFFLSLGLLLILVASVRRRVRVEPEAQGEPAAEA